MFRIWVIFLRLDSVVKIESGVPGGARMHIAWPWSFCNTNTFRDSIQNILCKYCRTRAMGSLASRKWREVAGSWMLTASLPIRCIPFQTLSTLRYCDMPSWGIVSIGCPRAMMYWKQTSLLQRVRPALQIWANWTGSYLHPNCSDVLKLSLIVHSY